jgi:hypothetical protein
MFTKCKLKEMSVEEHYFLNNNFQLKNISINFNWMSRKYQVAV